MMEFASMTLTHTFAIALGLAFKAFGVRMVSKHILIANNIQAHIASIILYHNRLIYNVFNIEHQRINVTTIT